MRHKVKIPPTSQPSNSISVARTNVQLAFFGISDRNNTAKWDTCFHHQTARTGRHVVGQKKKMAQRVTRIWINVTATAALPTDCLRMPMERADVASAKFDGRRRNRWPDPLHKLTHSTLHWNGRNGRRSHPFTSEFSGRNSSWLYSTGSLLAAALLIWLMTKHRRTVKTTITQRPMHT